MMKPNFCFYFRQYWFWSQFLLKLISFVIWVPNDRDFLLLLAAVAALRRLRWLGTVSQLGRLGATNPRYWRLRVTRTWIWARIWRLGTGRTQTWRFRISWRLWVGQTRTRNWRLWVSRIRSWMLGSCRTWILGAWGRLLRARTWAWILWTRGCCCLPLWIGRSCTRRRQNVSLTSGKSYKNLNFWN